MYHEGDNMMGVKRTNRSAVLSILHQQGGLSRKRLAESIRLTPAAITKIVGELLEERLLLEGHTLTGGGAGRKEVLLQLNPRAYCALGLFINLSQAMISAVWLDGTVIFSQELELESGVPANKLTERLAAKLTELIALHSIPRQQILGLGVAIRGITSEDGMRVKNSFGVFEDENYPLAQRLSKLTGFQVVMANNVRALFAAQMFMAREKDLTSQFFLRCEYGIGASLSIQDKIWCGSSQQCAEIGHIPVVRRGGKPCSCGKCGCLETIASPSAILEDALAALSPETTPILWAVSLKKGREKLALEDVLEAARNPDAGAAAIVDRAVEALSSALKAVIYILDPGKIVLYGRMFENSYYLARLLSDLGEGVDAGHTVPVEKSQYNQLLEDKAAGLLMVEHFFTNGGMK